jgi:hypothetical protein
VSAIPACIHFIGQYLPLERIYGLVHPSLAAPPVEDKRTWRGGVKPPTVKEKTTVTWTAMDVLTAYADKKGWITAKAGRPDVGRAGNASECTSETKVYIKFDLYIQFFERWRKGEFVGLSGHPIRKFLPWKEALAMVFGYLVASM